MTTALFRTVGRLGAVLCCLVASGCFVPGGGWTMRGGLDVRRRHKPSVFVELVDTRWDEYNRVAEMNITDGMMDSNVVLTPTSSPSAGPGIATPAVVPQPSGPSPFDSGQNPEPHPLPGMPEDPPPVPDSGPTARRSPAAGPRYLPSSNEENESTRTRGPSTSDGVGDDVLDQDGDDADAEVSLSSHSRSAGSRAGTTSNQAGNSAAPAAQKTPFRPAASRLFFRPR